MPISRSVRNFSARCLAPTLVAVSLVLAPAVGTVFLPAAAQAQDAIDFRVALEGYGQWVQHPRWGEVWIPEQVPPDWQPYRLGHWVYTEEWGWYWDSEEDFGWITYHYGRWVFDRGLGWIWIPGRDWGPAFVDWRQGDDFVGWAPLPPDEYLDEDYESPDTYFFVRAGDLLAPRVYVVFLPPQERFAYYNRSFLVNRSVRLGGGAHIAVNPGVPPAFIARASGRPFRPVSIAPIVLAGTAGVAGAIILRENFRDRERTLRLTERARRALGTILQRLDARVAHSGQLLSALSYRGVLARGFALVRDEQGHAVHAAAAVGPSAHLSIEFADGRVAATADADRPAATSAPASEPKMVAREPKTAAPPKRVAKPGEPGSALRCFNL